LDIRDLADLHVRTMTTAAAGGRRLIAAGDTLLMMKIANILREKLGSAVRV
jgi:dihydroflavonol-4-reductase